MLFGSFNQISAAKPEEGHRAYTIVGCSLNTGVTVHWRNIEPQWYSIVETF